MILSDAPLLELINLSCVRQQRLLFAELTVSIFPGQIWQVAGPNGAGKTSLLRILAGLTQPFEGEVRYQGNPLEADKIAYNQALLYIGHQAGVKGEMTAQENLEFALQLAQIQNQNAEQALEQVDLYGFEDEFASMLSAGQHRRIALARLWQTQSKLWILDEPFTAIDKSGVAHLEQKIKHHAENGGAVILTTHQDLNLEQQDYKILDLGDYAFGSDELEGVL